MIKRPRDTTFPITERGNERNIEWYGFYCAFFLSYGVTGRLKTRYLRQSPTVQYWCTPIVRQRRNGVGGRSDTIRLVGVAGYEEKRDRDMGL